MNTQYAIEMGKKVAKSMIFDQTTGSLEDLEKELNEIQTSKKEKILENYKKGNYPNINKILEIVVNNYKRLKLGSNSKISEKDAKDIGIEDFEKLLAQNKQKKSKNNSKNSNQNVLGLLSILTNYNKSSNKSKLKNVLFYSLFLYKLKNGHCKFCNKKGRLSNDYSLLKLFNPTNYKSDLQKFEICQVCGFYTYLSNYYPFINYKQKRLEPKYQFISFEDNIEKLFWFYENDFSRYVKDYYIHSFSLSEPKNDILVFYELGEKSSNNQIYAYGEMNIIKTLSKMLELKNGEKTVSIFKKTFFEGEILSNNKLGVHFFCNFIQNDYMPIELEKVYLQTVREKYGEKNILKNFLEFYRFLKLYLEVKKMESGEDFSPLFLGRKFGNEIVQSIRNEQASIENEIKFLVSLSGTMELGQNSFNKGILQILRRYREIKSGSYKIDKIAEDEKKRTEFLIGMLAVLFEQSRNQNIENNQS